MATLSLSGTGEPSLISAPPLRVEVRAMWLSEWAEVPYLQPIAATLATSPTVSSAQFVYRYGMIRREDGADFAQSDPVHLANHYVRILAYQGAAWQTLWMGVIQDAQYAVFGGAAPAGDQTITAYGFEHILDRCAVLGALTDDGEIGWCPAFNERPGWGAQLVGNKHPTLARFSVAGVPWSNADIIDYLLGRHAPPAIPWSYSGATAVLADLYGSYQLEGLTLRQCLDKLIDRRRGLGWTIRYGTGAPVIHVFSILDTESAVGDVIMPANAEQISVDVRTGILVGDVALATSQAAVYDAVLVQGARAKIAFSSSVASGSLERAWDVALEASYAAPGGSTAEDRDATRSGTRYESVYQHFRIPDTWNWTDYAGADASVAFDDFARFDTAHTGPRWNNRRPLLRYLPIEDPVNVGEMLRPMAFLEFDGSPYQTDRLGQIGRPACSMSLLDGCPGIALSAGINHVLGANHFDDTETSTAPVYDYATLIATVAIDADARPSVRVAVPAVAADFARTLVLDVPDAHYWYVVPGTIVGCEAGVYTRHPGGVTRDDTARLRQIAAMAAAWYGRQRATLRWYERLLSPQFAPGQLVTDVTSGTGIAPVGTVITQVTFDFQKFQTSIATAFGELDFSIVLDIPGMSDFRSVGRAFNRLHDDVRELRRHLGRMPVREAPGAAAPTTDEDAPGAVVDWWCDDFDRGPDNTIGYQWSLPEGFFINQDGSCYSGTIDANKPSYFNKRISGPFSVSVKGNMPMVYGAGNAYSSGATYDTFRSLASHDGLVVLYGEIAPKLCFSNGITQTIFYLNFSSLYRAHAPHYPGVYGTIYCGLKSIYESAIAQDSDLWGGIVSPGQSDIYFSDASVSFVPSYNDLLSIFESIIDTQQINMLLTINDESFSVEINQMLLFRKQNPMIIGSSPIKVGFMPTGDYRNSPYKTSVDNISVRSIATPDSIPVNTGYGRWSADDGFTVLG